MFGVFFKKSKKNISGFLRTELKLDNSLATRAH